MKCEHCRATIGRELFLTFDLRNMKCSSCGSIVAVSLGKSLIFSFLSALAIALVCYTAGLDYSVAIFAAIFGGGIVSRVFLILS